MENKNEEPKEMLARPADPAEEAKRIFTKDNPHPTGAYWDPELLRWKGYKATKGLKPPWDPYNHAHRKRKLTFNEKKFLYIYSQTGKLSDAFKSTYKYTQYPDKRVEDGRVRALAEQVMRRIKEKAPDLVAAYCFDDMTPDWIKREYMKIYNHDHATIGEKRAILADMAKINAMFTDKVITDTKIREVIQPVYAETADDFVDVADERKSRADIDPNIPVA